MNRRADQLVLAFKTFRQQFIAEPFRDQIFIRRAFAGEDGAARVDEEFYSGEKYTLRVLIGNRAAGEETPLAGIAVSIKILGTTFRPLIYTLKTERDGVASVQTQIPQFTSGRAAVLVRAVAKDQAAELRRIIHPAR